MLTWTVGAAVPLLVHLLSRSRYRSVEWGAMMYLAGTASAQQRSSRVKQWVLLAIRSMIVGLLAVALARPVLAGRYAAMVPTAGLTTGGQATVILIVDDSASMGYVQNGKTRLDQARAVALQILAKLQHGDQAALLLAGGAQDSSPPVPSADLQSIASRIGDLTPGTGEADFADMLQRAASLLDHAGETDREIYLVSDRQALSWRRLLDPAFATVWAARKAAGTLPRVTVFSVGGYESDNVAIDSIRIVDQRVIRDQPAELELRIKNFGTTPVVAVPLSVWAGPRTLGEANLTIPPNATRQTRMRVRFPEAGSFVISAAIKSSGLTYDDRLDRAVDVSDPIRALLISGEESADSAEGSETSFLRFALSPNASTGRNGVDPMIVTVASAEQWTNLPLDKFQVVVLADVSHLSPEQIRDLEQFVYEGGGVWFAPGHRVRTDVFNQLLYRAGSGVFPAALGAPTPSDAPVDLTLGNLDRQHPIFRFLPEGPIPLASIRRYFSSIPRVPDAKTVASFSNGQPFLIETSAGRGHVLMSTTGFEDGWTDIARTPFFLPFAQSIVRYLAAPQIEDRNLSPYQPIIATVSGAIDDRPPIVQLTPGGRREPATVRRFEDRTEMRYYRTDTPGTYRLRYRANGVEKTINFVVTGSRAESDLTPLTDDQWQVFRRRFGIEHADPTPTAVAETVDHQRGGRELWIDLLGGVLMLSLCEVILSKWWTNMPFDRWRTLK